MAVEEPKPVVVVAVEKLVVETEHQHAVVVLVAS